MAGKHRAPEQEDPNRQPPPERVTPVTDRGGSIGNKDDGKRGRGGSPYER